MLTVALWDLVVLTVAIFAIFMAALTVEQMGVMKVALMESTVVDLMGILKVWMMFVLKVQN